MKYLGSTKNLAGSAAGLAGIVLHLLGVVGSVWPVVVLALYAAGALLAPADRVRLVPAGAELRADLVTLLAQVSEHSGRMPERAVAQVRRIGEVLTAVLDRPADPDLQHRVIRLTRVDLPTSVQTYLNVPWWFASKDGRAAQELIDQLDLLEQEADRIAEQSYADELRRQEDHTRYLRHRPDGPEHQ